MKKLRLMALLMATSLIVTACNNGPVTFDYIRLQNNVTGFTTADGDTAIAIGLKKGSPLKAGIDAYLSTLTTDYWTELMGQMVALQNDDSATYTYTNPNYNPGRNGGVFKVGMECE